MQSSEMVFQATNNSEEATERKRTDEDRVQYQVHSFHNDGDESSSNLILREDPSDRKDQYSLR